MAELEKKRRSQSLSNFTRSINAFNTLITQSATTDLVKPAFANIMSCWELLETAQGNFIDKTDIDVEKDVNGIKFLDEPEKRHSGALRSYSDYLNKDKDSIF